MAKGRMITKGVSCSEKLPLLSDKAFKLFVLLIPHWSSHGKMNGEPAYIKGEVCPLYPDLTIPRIKTLLLEISQKTNVKWFKFGNLNFLHSLNFKEHQPDLRDDRMGDDPFPDFTNTLPDNSGILPDDSSLKVKVKVKEKMKEKGGLFDFEALWVKYPKDKDGLRKGKKEAERHFIASVKTEQDWKDINRAIEKYSKSSTVLGGYVKNGSSWFNNWRDFVPTPEKEKAVFKPKPNPCRTCGQPATLNGLCQKCNDAPLSPQEREEFEKAKKDLPKLLSQIGKPMPSGSKQRPEVLKALEEERSKR